MWESWSVPQTEGTRGKKAHGIFEELKEKEGAGEERTRAEWWKTELVS